MLSDSGPCLTWALNKLIKLAPVSSQISALGSGIPLVQAETESAQFLQPLNLINLKKE